MYYMFGDMTRLLKPEEVAFIAERTDFLTIEKSHGFEPLGAAELGTKHEVEAFKKVKPNTKVLFYFNSAYAWPFTSYNQNITPEKINDSPELKKLLLVNPKTGELGYRDSYIRHVYFWDVLNPECRKWWVDTVAKGVKESGADGAFIDQMHGFAWLRPDKSDEVQRAQGELLATLKKKLGPDKIVLGNNVHQDIAKHVFPVVDAGMLEHYNSKLLSKEGLLQDWGTMLRFAQVGKMSIFRIGAGQDPFRRQYEERELSRDQRILALARKRLEYHLACFLIGAQPYSYFQYGWGWDLEDGSLYDYLELHKPLGPPKGPYQRTTLEGWEFTREFEHAHVWVDTEKGQGKITWK